MGNLADGKDLSADASTWPPLPLKVRVTYNGLMKEMTETSRGQWAEVSWPYVSVSNVYDPDNYYEYRYVTYQLIFVQRHGIRRGRTSGVDPPVQSAGHPIDG